MEIPILRQMNDLILLLFLPMSMKYKQANYFHWQKSKNMILSILYSNLKLPFVINIFLTSFLKGVQY